MCQKKKSAITKPGLCVDCNTGGSNGNILANEARLKGLLNTAFGNPNDHFGDVDEEESKKKLEKQKQILMEQAGKG